MQTPWYLPWLSAGVTVGFVYLAAILIDRFCRTTFWRRLVWQTAATCCFALGIGTLTGLDRAAGTYLLEHLPFPHTGYQAVVTSSTAVVPEGGSDRLVHSQNGGVSGAEGLRSLTSLPLASEGARPAGTVHGGASSPSERQAASQRTWPLQPSATADAAPALAPTAAVPTPGPSQPESPPGIALRMVHQPLLGGLWLLGASIMWLHLHWSHLRMSLACKPNRRLVGGPISDFINGWASRLQFRSKIAIYLLPEVKTPVAFGIFRPSLGLPENFPVLQPDRAEQAVLLHELAHLAARDPLWRYVARLGTAVLWWHPASWATQRRFDWASELAADEASAWLTDGPRHLARGLLRYGRLVAPSPHSVVAAGGNGFSSALARRVSRLIRMSRPTSNGHRRCAIRSASISTVVMTALAVFSSTVWAAAAWPLPTEKGGGFVMNRFLSSWRGSLAAVTLAAVLSPWSTAAADEERPEGPPPDGDRPPVAEREREEGPWHDRGPDRERAEGKGERREMDRPRPPQPDEVRERIEQAVRRIQAAQDELRERAETLRREMEGADEAKARIREAMEGIEREMRELEARKREIFKDFELRRPPLELAAPDPVGRLERHLAELREAIAHAREEHRMDDVERLEREIAAVEGKLREVREHGPFPHPMPPEQMERLHRAAELLRREGLGDMAELLLRSAQPVPPHPDGPPGSPPPHHDGPPGPPPHEPR